MTIERPEGQNLVIRTSFSSDVAWDGLRAAVVAHAGETEFSFVNNSSFDGSDPVDVLAFNGPEDPGYVFLADAQCLSQSEYPVLAVSVDGTHLRVIPEFLADVADNLTVGNLLLDEYVEAADGDGVLRH